jgi:hypothetical protein
MTSALNLSAQAALWFVAAAHGFAHAEPIMAGDAAEICFENVEAGVSNLLIGSTASMCNSTIKLA